MNVIIQNLWDLLQVTGWWTLTGLLFGFALVCSPIKPFKSKSMQALFAAAAGALLPVCNFGAAPIACALLCKGFDLSASFAFFAAASLLNPAGVLYSFAYMGGRAAFMYLLCSAAVLAGCIALGLFEEGPSCAVCEKESYPDLSLRLCLWAWIGALLQALLIGSAGGAFWKSLVLSAPDAGWLSAFAGGALRHLCIPDDVSLAASLVASGMKPGPGILLLIAGALTDLPALLMLRAKTGPRSLWKYLAVMILCAFASAFLLQHTAGRGFVPHYDLRGAEALTYWGNLLNLPLWRPARIPGACLFSAAALAGLAKNCRHGSVFTRFAKRIEKR